MESAPPPPPIAYAAVDFGGALAFRGEIASVLKEKRKLKGIGHNKRVTRLAKTGGDVMRAVFGGGAAAEPRVVGEFLLEKSGTTTTISKRVFEAKDKCIEAYDARTLDDGDAWLSTLRGCRASGERYTDGAFPPNPLGGTDSPTIGLSSAYRQTTWARLSEIYRQSRWISVNLEDMDDRHAACGQCCGYDPNLREAPCIPPTIVDDVTTAKRITFATAKARALVDAMLSNGGASAYEGLIWPEGGAAFAEGLKKMIDQFPVNYKSIGRTHVQFIPSPPKPGYIVFGRFTVAVELRFGQDVHMFEREEGDASVVEPGDINQGALGDCYYLCALSILSTHERLLFDALPDIPDDLRHAEALSTSPEDEQTFNTEGVYAVRFWRDGKWRIVVVDDFVPMHPQDASRFLFTSPSKNSAEIWCVVAEKAFAKLNGSYSVLEGGQAEEALEDLCGGVPFNFTIGSRRENKSGPYGSGVATAQADLWRDMMKWRDEESMVGVSWSNNGGTDKEIRMGCFGNHAYGVLAVFDVTLTDGSHVKLVNVRNPHGHGGEYSGDWSDADQAHWALVSPEDRRRIGYSLEDDGTFFMCFADFWSFWETLCVCRPLMPTPCVNAPLLLRERTPSGTQSRATPHAGPAAGPLPPLLSNPLPSPPLPPRYIDTTWMFFNIFGEWAGPSATGFPNIAHGAQFQVVVDERQEIQPPPHLSTPRGCLRQRGARGSLRPTAVEAGGG